MSIEKGLTVTLDHIEDDLTLNYDEEKIISPEKKAEYFKIAAIHVLQDYGKFVDGDILHTAFPNLDIENIDNYDFKNSKIKLFVLDNETYDAMVRGMFGGNPSGEDGLFARGQDYGHEKLSFSLRSELAGQIYIRQDVYDKGQMDKTLRHEILHSLRIGDDLPEYLEEGLVTYLAIISGHKRQYVNSNTEDKQEKVTEKKLKLSGVVDMIRDFANKSYNSRAAVFAVLHAICVKNEGWADDQYYEAVIDKNSTLRKELKRVMVRNADQEILDYFKLMSEFYKE